MIAKARFDNLQYIRGLAAFLVVISHFGRIGGLGNCGVALFFVISGFIMTTTTWEKFGFGVNAREFLVRRLGRIIMPWWICLSVKLVIDSRPESPLWVVGSYLLLPVASPSGLIEPIHGVGWSLVWEMVFYYIFAVSLLFERRAGLLFLSAALLVLTTAGFIYPDFRENAWHGNLIFVLFLAGVAVGILVQYSRFYRYWWIILGVSSALMILTLIVGDKTAVFPYLNVVASVGIILASVLAPNVSPNSALTRAAHFLGDASFSLYITHTLLISVLNYIFRNSVRFRIESLPYILIGIVGSLIVAMGFYYVVEKPVINFTHAVVRRLNARSST